MSVFERAFEVSDSAVTGLVDLSGAVFKDRLSFDRTELVGGARASRQRDERRNTCRRWPGSMTTSCVTGATRESESHQRDQTTAATTTNTDKTSHAAQITRRNRTRPVERGRT